MSMSAGAALLKPARRLRTTEEFAELVRNHDNFLLDCDGVLWAGDERLPGSIETVQHLRSIGKRLFFITNNSSKSRRMYAEKIRKFGASDVGEDEIVTSGSAIAEYVRQTYPDVTAVYMVGEAGLQEELEKVGLRCVQSERRADLMSEEEFRGLELDEEVGAVVVGWDRGFSFRQCATASLYIQGGRPFVGTNPDHADRVGTRLFPGTGPILDSIKSASSVEPLIIGKPNPLLIRQIMAVHGLDPARTIMVGDRLDTDILFGNTGGVNTGLVLSGVSTESAVEILPAGAPNTPSFVLDRLGCLLPSV